MVVGMFTSPVARQPHGPQVHLLRGRYTFPFFGAIVQDYHKQESQQCIYQQTVIPLELPNVLVKMRSV